MIYAMRFFSTFIPSDMDMQYPIISTYVHIDNACHIILTFKPNVYFLHRSREKIQNILDLEQ